MLILLIKLIGQWAAQTFGVYCECLWRCLWMKLTFELVDLIKQFAFPNVGWPSSYQLNTCIEQEDWIGGNFSWRGAGTLVFLAFRLKLKHWLTLGPELAGFWIGIYTMSSLGAQDFRSRLELHCYHTPTILGVQFANWRYWGVSASIVVEANSIKLYILIYAHTHIYMYIYVYMYTCIYIYIHTYVCRHTHTIYIYTLYIYMHTLSIIHIHTCTHTHPINPFFPPKTLMCKLCWCSGRTLVPTFQIPWCGAFLALPIQYASIFILSLAWQLEEGKGWGSEDRKLPIPDASTTSGHLVGGFFL